MAAFLAPAVRADVDTGDGARFFVRLDRLVKL